MATKQRCPKCNQLNALDAAHCAHCNAPLVVVCPRCGRSRAWYVPRCPSCDAQADDVAAFTSLFRRTPSQRLHGRYLIRETLASGPISTVYRATDIQNPDVTVAIKELSTTALFRAEERRQAESALNQALERWSRVEHAAIPRLIESFSEQAQHYVVLEFVDGWSLEQIISEGRRILPELARSWGVQLCDLLECLHAQNPPLHVPFLSPGHIMVNVRGDLKLVDWGLTALFAPNAYGPYGSIRGYIPPELEGEAPTVQTDLFALGRLLYALLTGQLLEKAAVRQLPLRQAVPGISDKLVRAIAQAAHRDPKQRFISAADFRIALEHASSGPLVPAADWIQWTLQPSAPQAITAPILTQQTTPTTESMADLGYVRDPRYGAEPLPEVVPQPKPKVVKFSVQPQQFNLQDLGTVESKRIVLSLRNTGEAELSARVMSHVPWLTAPAKVIQLLPNKEAKVILSVHMEALPSGRTNEPHAISVETNVGRKWIGVNAEVAPGSLLAVEEAILDFGTHFRGDAERARVLHISNKGRHPLKGTVSSRVPWLRVAKSEFYCAAGQTIQVPVQVVPERLPRGAQKVEDALVVDSDGGQAQVEVRAWHQRPELDLGSTHMDLGEVISGQVVERYLYVGNTGDGPLEGVCRSLLSWLQASPQQIACAPGDMVQIMLTADSAGLPDGTIEIPQALRVQTNAGTQTLSLSMQVRAPKMALGTTELSFGHVPLGETRDKRLIIRNSGSAPLQAIIQCLPDWLRASQSEIVCEPGAEVVVNVRVETARFERGQEIMLPVAVRVISGATVAEIPASLTVLQPSLRVEPQEVDFGYIDPIVPEARALMIANEGTGKLAWNAQTDAAWVEIIPREGVCEAGQTNTLTLTAYGLAIEKGAQAASSTLIINSDGGRAKVPLRVALAAPLIMCDTSFLDLGTSINLQNVSGAFRIFNHGLGLLRGSISTDKTWLVVDRASFECPMGQSIEIQVRTDMDEFPKGASYARGTINLTSNGGNLQIEAILNVALVADVYAPSERIHLARPEADKPLQAHLTLKNRGRAAAHVQLRASASQLVLSRDVCDIKPDKSVRITLTWQGDWPIEAGSPFIDIVAGEQHLRVPIDLAPEAEQHNMRRAIPLVG